MFKVQVLGTIWQGTEAAYEYTTDFLPAEESHFPAAVKQLAGDFASVSDFSILQPSPCSHCGHVQFTVLTDWNDAESEDKYLAATYGDN